tara:strand:- start:5268 stop:6986 length:1719 start_codon:yes stop_codon:yes gene_type:complete
MISKDGWNILEKNEKRKFILIIFLFILLSILEVLGIAAVIPFIIIILNPEKLSDVQSLNFLSDIIENNKEILFPISSILFLGVFFIKNIFSIFTYSFIYKFIGILKASLSTRVLKKYIQQDYLFFVQNSHAKLSTHMSTETSMFSEQYLESVMISLSEIIILLGIFCLIIFSGDIKIFLALAPIIIISLLVVKFLKKKIKRWSNQREKLIRNFSILNQKIFMGIRDIYLSNKNNVILKNFFNLSSEYSFLNIRNSTVSLIPKALLELLGILALLLIVFYFFISGTSNDEIITNLTFYFLIAYRSLPSINKILVQSQRIKYSKNSIPIIKEILAKKNSRNLEINQKENINFKKSINYKKITFSYSKTKQLIFEEDFEINKGEIIGIYGESGSGKSTLLNILTLLIEPDDGEIYLDGNKLNTADKKRNLQNKMSFISQDSFLIEGTIKDNIILYSDQKIDNDKIDLSLKLSKADKFINELDDGIDYKLGTLSRKISSGQKQRIVLARCFYEDKSIIILDEATNALDEETEKAIFHNILKTKKDKTIIIVSHNINNIGICGKVYKIENGKIVKKQ